MILNLLMEFGFWFFGLIGGMFPASQPVLYSASNLFYDLIQFGVWVIGDDMWGFFVGTVAGWLTFKITGGLILFIYRLIPFL